MVEAIGHYDNGAAQQRRQQTETIGRRIRPDFKVHPVYPSLVSVVLLASSQGTFVQRPAGTVWQSTRRSAIVRGDCHSDSHSAADDTLDADLGP